MFDFQFLSSINSDVNISKCFKCGDFGHKDNTCETEVVFKDVSEHKDFR